VIGVGSRERGDDAAGLLAARFLRTRVPEGVAVFCCSADPVSLFEAWAGAERVWLTDAVMSGAPAGTVHRIDVATQALLPRPRCRSTHGLGLAEAVELGRTLGRLPRSLVIYGIEAASFRIGGLPSAAVRAGARAAAAAISAELAAEPASASRRADDHGTLEPGRLGDHSVPDRLDLER
jgi:hydrogenase maturation protease